MKKVIAAILTLLVVLAFVYVPYAGGLVAERWGLYVGQSWFSIWGNGFTFLVMAAAAIAMGLGLILVILAITYRVYESILDLIGG